VRYVYLGVPYEKDGQQIAPTIPLDTFFANRESAAASGTGYDTRISFRASGSPNGQPNFWTPQKYNFAPRFAFAYATKDNKTAIHGGFSIAYDHFGEGVIDSYQSNSNRCSRSRRPISLPSRTSLQSALHGFNSVPAVAGATASLSLPYTPADSAFTFDYSINDKQKTPYAETFNLSVQHEFPHSMTVTGSYVGRLGHHLVQNLDVAMPTNLSDPTSGQTYFQAATAFDKMVDQGVDPATVPDSGYFHNLFPNFKYEYKVLTPTPASTGTAPRLITLTSLIIAATRRIPFSQPTRLDCFGRRTELPLFLPADLLRLRSIHNGD